MLLYNIYSKIESRGLEVNPCKTYTEPKKKTRKMSASSKQLWMLSIIPIISVFIFSYVPMFGIILAFKRYNYSGGIFGSPWVGFENFRYLIESDNFYRIIRNTLVMNFLFILIGTIAAVGLALLLYRLTSRNKTKVYQTILITPNFLSWVVVAYMVYAILNPQHGVLNGILMRLGFEAVPWYGEPNAWPAILVIINVWKTVGMNSVIYYAAMMGIDESQFEAARIDGASDRQITRKIIIPGITGPIIMMTILNIGNIFRADFGLFYQIPRNVGKLYPTTDVIDTYIFRTLREDGNMGVSSAVGLLQSCVGFVLVVLTNTIVKKINSDNALL